MCLRSKCVFVNFKFLIFSCKVLEQVFGLPTSLSYNFPCLSSELTNPSALFLSYKHTNQEFYAKVDTLVKECGCITLDF